MNANAALRQELHAAIDTMSGRNLAALKPLFTVLAEPLYTIEPATSEETKKAERRIREYHKDPSSFIPRAKARKR
ncbi:hypothetical protein FACS189483_09110 [Spirochaetia bacterium]|nr:hypothetical protein FACS189483_09110 [Spirochaetia bacterium]